MDALIALILPWVCMVCRVLEALIADKQPFIDQIPAALAALF